MIYQDRSNSTWRDLSICAVLPAVSDVYWLTWQSLSIGLSARSSNCLSIQPACACARTALDIRSHAGGHNELRHRQQQLIWPVVPTASPVDPVRAVSLITIDIRLCTNPWGQFPQLHKRASGGPLVATGWSNPWIHISILQSVLLWGSSQSSPLPTKITQYKCLNCTYFNHNYLPLPL